MPRTANPFHRALAALTMLMAALAMLAAAPLRAEPRRIDTLADVLRIGDVVDVMRAEGLRYGADIAAEMFPGRSKGAWPMLVDRIYAADVLETTVLDRLDTELAGVDLAPLEAFFGSKQGQEITELEISARRALLDNSVEEAATEAARTLASDDPELDELLHDFIAVNDLVEANVVGALNSSYAFYTGLAEGDAFADSLTEDQILSDVWGQEPEIRAETEDWLLGYLALAFRPLGRDDMAAYVAISETPEGQALNRALFAAYDQMYVTISRQLGAGAAQFLAGEEL